MAKTKVAMVAKEIRAELKAAFPNVKFSVRSSNYSMGCSIRVGWTDLPSVEAVEEITEKYANVRRCELTGDILGGGNMFIFAEQELSPEFKETVESQMEDHEKDSLYWRSSAMNRIMNKMWDEQNEKADCTKLCIESGSDNLECETTNRATLTINEEKNGIEIKFDSKPSDNVIGVVKEMGFKWSKYAKVWWAKQSSERLKFASMLVEQYNVIIEEEPMTEAVENDSEVHNVSDEVAQDMNETNLQPENVVSLDTFMKKKAEKVVGVMTPEQRLKLDIVTRMIGKEQAAIFLVEMNVDQLFKYIAESAVLIEYLKEE